MRRLRVLLVDDDDVYWELAQLAIQRSDLGFTPTVERVCDGPQALAYLGDQRRDLPQLVLLDQRMPRMDGTEVLVEVRKHHPWRGIPIGFMSSSDSRDLVEEAYVLGASFFMVKPLGFSELTEKFKVLLEFWASVAELPPV